MIAKLVDEAETVSISELSIRFNVTDTSIRHDLAVLEDAGRLHRVRGGGTSRETGRPSSVFTAKARENRAEKRRIGRAAAGLIRPGNVILLDSGSTVMEVAAHMPHPLRCASAITVVTNSLPAIQEVGRWEQPHLITLGGIYLSEYQVSVGPPAINQLRGLTADLAFLGCDGFTIEGGLSTPHMLVAELTSAMAARASRVVVVADATKLGRSGFTPFLPVNAVNVLVTDDRADRDFVKHLEDIGIAIILV
jgi:DeoR/GlpR family transcriptional regulator of sugar metabolism